MHCSISVCQFLNNSNWSVLILLRWSWRSNSDESHKACKKKVALHQAELTSRINCYVAPLFLLLPKHYKKVCCHQRQGLQSHTRASSFRVCICTTTKAVAGSKIWPWTKVKSRVLRSGWRPFFILQWQWLKDDIVHAHLQVSELCFQYKQAQACNFKHGQCS